MSIEAMYLTGKVLVLATPLLILLGVPLGLFLAKMDGMVRAVCRVLVLLPLVLPPTVVGYGLLMLLGHRGLEGWFGLDLLFTWPAAAVASTVVGLPLVVISSEAAIENVPERFRQAAETLGSGELEILMRVTLPLAWPGILAGIVLGVARAMGEFGATMMIAGNIPGKTQTAPLAIYQAVQTRQYETANLLVLFLTGLCVLGVFLVNRLESSTVS